MKDERWLLPAPPPNLTKNEFEWFDWAESAAIEVLDDPQYMDDNDDALTFEGQADDMRYRLEEQGPSVAETDGTTPQINGRLRSLKSLLAKLEAVGYFKPSEL